MTAAGSEPVSGAAWTAADRSKLTASANVRVESSLMDYFAPDVEVADARWFNASAMAFCARGFKSA